MYTLLPTSCRRFKSNSALTAQAVSEKIFEYYCNIQGGGRPTTGVQMVYVNGNGKITAQPICVFVFTYADCWFTGVAAYIKSFRHHLLCTGTISFILD